MYQWFPATTCRLPAEAPIDTKDGLTTLFLVVAAVVAVGFWLLAFFCVVVVVVVAATAANSVVQHLMIISGPSLPVMAEKKKHSTKFNLNPSGCVNKN